MTLEARAQAFATHCHGITGQVRKFSGEPYIVHPATVAEIVRSVPHTEEMLAAAWLHDVVEDTPATQYQILIMFGLDVSRMVRDLTNYPSSFGPRKMRKDLDRLRLAAASPQVQTIKLADIIDNSRDIQAMVETDPVFAHQYLDEKRQEAAVLTHGDPELLKWALHLTHSRHVSVLHRVTQFLSKHTHA